MAAVISHWRFQHFSRPVLRRVWLNLRNKHMTTGRINQVAAEQPFAFVAVRGRCFILTQYISVKYFLSTCDLMEVGRFVSMDP